MSRISIKKCSLAIVIIGMIISFLGVDNANAEGIKPEHPVRDKENNFNLPQPVEQKELIVPQVAQVEYIFEALAFSINRVNLSQTDGSFDETDLNEDFKHFSYNKYQEVLQGKRNYRYLQFQTYWDDHSKDTPHIRVLVNIPDSENNVNDAQYLEEILQTLENQYRIDTSRIDPDLKAQVVRDIANGNHLTCVKSLRLVWALFTQSDQQSGLFPQVFKLNVAKAGELVNYVNNGDHLFSVPNVLQAAQMSKTIATNIEPNARPTLFKGKMVIYFRPILNNDDTGHVGISWISQSDQASDEQISFFEVNGETGMAHYQSNVHIKQFKTRLYNILPQVQSEKALIGWFINL